jgi:hypothetical protein
MAAAPFEIQIRPAAILDTKEKRDGAELTLQLIGTPPPPINVENSFIDNT